MASTLVLLLLLLVSLGSASHNLGGSVTYSYKGRDASGGHLVEVRTKDTFDGCYNSHYWSCYSGQCGFEFNKQTRTIDNSTNSPRYTNQWCETESVSIRKIWSDKPFLLRAASCCWIRTRNSVSSWNLLASIDLGVRSDTKAPNKSPDIAILPFIRVPQNCRRRYELMAFDPDGDHVRCRYGNWKHVECSRCDKPSGFILDENSCTLTYQYTWSSTAAYAFEMMVEDFPQRNINLLYSDGSQTSNNPLSTGRKKRSPYFNWTPTPANATSATTTHWLNIMSSGIVTNPYSTSLSKLPLQFSFLVDPSVPSCLEGEYLPKLVYPTPKNKEHLQAEANKQMQITVRGQARLSGIIDLLMTGPQNISSSRASGDAFTIKWTPMLKDVGEFFPICFAIESRNGSRFYHSEMRCVLVEVVPGKVGPKKVQTTVECTETTMIVTVDKSTFARIHEDHLRLNDAANTACRLTSNSTHIIGIIPLSACGTEIAEDKENLYFRNEITTVDSLKDVITRKHLLEVQFACQYPKRQNVTLAFRIHRDNVTVVEKGFGTFTYTFEFYTNSQFQTMEDPSSYPLEYEIGTRIYMQIEATTTVNNTELFVESCSAAPYDTPNYIPTYGIIQNGCNVDPTVITHPRNHHREFRFSMEAFKFIGLHDQVYISCQVMMCKEGGSTRCSRGCVSSGRRKREAASETARHFISQGPLRLRGSAESPGLRGPAMSPALNLNLVFVAGCVLAALAMISALVVYKTKMSGVRYRPLPTQDSDAAQ